MATQRQKARLAGAAMVEYVIAVAVVLACAAVLSILLYTFRSYGDRVLALAAGEYP